MRLERNFYNMATTPEEDSVEITLYGDVVEERPWDWWNDKPVEGNFIVLNDFLADFEKFSKCKKINFRINSYGGDCVTAFVIHNRIRDLIRDGAEVSCVIDGCAMSAASIIMAACDNVKVNPASLVMIHKCWSYIWGGYNGDELRSMAEQNDAYDKAIASAYARKTGLSETVIMHMMGDTTYMTGKEAVEKGFADELLEDAEPLNLAASADGKTIFVRGRQMHLAPGMFAPDVIPTISPEAEASVIDKATINEPEDTGRTEGGTSPMTMDELKTLVIMLNPVAPHITEEIWEAIGCEGRVYQQTWPEYDEAKCKDDEITLVVQVNGKVRSKITAPAGLENNELLAAAKADEKVKSWLDGKTIIKEIVVPGKLVNFVVK